MREPFAIHARHSADLASTALAKSIPTFRVFPPSQEWYFQRLSGQRSGLPPPASHSPVARRSPVQDPNGARAPVLPRVISGGAKTWDYLFVSQGPQRIDLGGPPRRNIART